MTSSNLSLEQRRRTYVRMIGEIRHALNQALAEEHSKNGLTKAKMAKELKKNKAFITRALVGTGNMTLQTLADLAYTLNRPVKISLPSQSEAAHGYGCRPETAGGDKHLRRPDLGIG